METNPAPQKPVDDLPKLNELPFIKWIAGISLLTALFGGILLEISRISSFYPVGTIRLAHYLAVSVYMMASLTAISIAGAIWFKGWKLSYWTESERNIFCGSFSVGTLFMLTGLEFLEVELWNVHHPFSFFIAKILLSILVIRYILRILHANRHKLENQ